MKMSNTGDFSRFRPSYLGLFDVIAPKRFFVYFALHAFDLHRI